MQNNRGALRSLSESGVEFILVGGFAAILNGAPVITLDLDVVYSATEENIARLLKWVDDADAIFRMQPERRLRPNRSHLAAARHMNLLTRYGRLDLLGFIGDGLKYGDLIPVSEEMEIGEGIRIRVLNLETIIQVKEKLATEKDLAVLPILRSTLKMIRNKKS
jgi:predicted nucleotidyltransferase